MATDPGTMTRKPGVLPIGSAQPQAHHNGDANKSAKGRSAVAQDGVKAKLRWLPPGMTEDEFVSVLGDSWKVGNGKVAWFRFSPGHMPKGASKDPVPAWAQFQVKEEHLEELAQAVRSTVWEDAKGTFNSTSLIGPPYLERAIYKKIPNTKSKNDPKEGTIDEDDEWQTFLVTLTQDPDGKKGDLDAVADEATIAEPAAKPHVTALVAHILESKANKVKEAANAKSRRHTRHDSLGKGKATAPVPPTDEYKKKSRDRADRPNATVRILKKQAAATEAAAEAAKAVAKDLRAGTSTTQAASGRRRVGGISDILKRDLGLAGPTSRRSRQEARQDPAAPKPVDVEVKPQDAKSKATGATLTMSSTSFKTTANSSTPTTPKPPVEKASRGGRRKGGKDAKTSDAKTGGSSEALASSPIKPLVILQKKRDDSSLKLAPATATATPKDATPVSKAATKSAAAAAASTPPIGPKLGNGKGSPTTTHKKANAPSSGTTRAFLKHANPSQGVTEALLKEAMGVFGAVSSVEIDRRKGFAYVDFVDHSGLVKALGASPVNIANAAVQVLERKDQTPKKAAVASSPTIAVQAKSKEMAPSETPSIATVPLTKPSAPTPIVERANIADHQPAKRSRRRGRGKGGNSGIPGLGDSKTTDKGGHDDGAGPSTASPAPVPGDPASAG